MANNSIGTMHVDLTTNTSQFVSGMAKSEAAIERVARTASKSRAAIGALGGAFKAPGLSRAGAFGGAAEGVLSGLGLGALAGGVGGLAATGLFVGVSKAMEFLSQNAQSAAETLKRMAASAEQNRQAYADYSAEIEKRQLSVANVISDLVDPGGRKTRTQREAILSQINEVSAEVQRLKEQRNVAVAFRVRSDIAAADESLARAEQALARLNEQFQATRAPGLAGRLVGSIGDARRKNPLEEFAAAITRSAQASKEAAAQAREQAEASRALEAAIQEQTDQLIRSNQRSSDVLATSVAGIDTQVRQILTRRH